MIDLDETSVDEPDLRARLVAAAGTAPPGAGPSPDLLVARGRRAVRRRRAARGAALVSACAVAAVGVAGIAGGSVTLPWLRADADQAAPGRLYASPGSRVGDIVNAMETLRVVVPAPEGDVDAGRWYYRAGSLVPGAARGDEPVPDVDLDDVKKAGVDRAVDIHALDGAERRYRLRLARVDPATTAVTSERELGELGVGADGRGRWLQVRPGGDDDWLLFAVLPDDAEQIQVRVRGTTTLLPVEGDAAARTRECIEDGSGQEISCTETGKSFVRLHLALGGDQPPIDAVTYIDGEKFVTLGESTGTTIR